MTLNGIDVSAIGQGANFDWQAYKGRIQFAGIKLSEGTTFADPDAARNVAGARSIGAVPMGYHFLHANSDAAIQAEHFLGLAKAAGIGPGDLVAVDVEQGGMDGQPAANLWGAALRFALEVHDALAAWTVVYTDISLAQAAPGFADLAACPLWLANPSGNAVSAIGPWKLVSFEQRGQTGVDTDVFYGDAAQLAALAIPRPQPVTVEVNVQLPVLRQGSTGQQVGNWQALLCSHGFGYLIAPPDAPGLDVMQRAGLDGVYGPKTDEGTRKFQEDRHLQPTGVVGAAEWEAALS